MNISDFFRKTSSCVPFLQMYTDFIVVDIRFSYVNMDEIQGYCKLFGQFEVTSKQSQTRNLDLTKLKNSHWKHGS
jgi:hypothetical protein